MGSGRHDFYSGRRRRSPVLPAFMSITVLGLAAVVFILLRPTIGGVVTDDYTGDPLGGVQVSYAGQRTKTDAYGRFTLTPQRSQLALSVASPPGYRCADTDFRSGTDKQLAITCRPTTLSGTLRRKNGETPLPGIVIRAANGQGEQTPEVVTDDEGRYALAEVPDDARLIIEGPGFARKEVEIGRTSVFDLELRPDVLVGKVRAQNGAPLPGALVGAIGATAVAGNDGGYTLAGVAEAGRVVARAPGYRAQAIEPGDDPRIDFILEPLVVKAIYLTSDALAKDATFKALLALIDRTELNALVIDIKDEDGQLLYNSQIPLARAIGAVHPAYDLGARLKTLREHNVYAIARVVCMLDPTLAKAKPEWAVRNSTTGGIWKNSAGIAWTNAMRPEVWRYTADIALEAAEMGFDEVQFDYVRFPSDGDMDAIDLGAPDNSATRSKAIHDLLKLAHDALSQRGVALAADIFGIALWDPRDNGIGQQLEQIALVVDYICPMVYPSHFAPGSLGYGRPNDHPYEVILESLINGDKRIVGAKAKFRPWLQDFTYGPGIAYGPNEVRAQIKATYDFGATGWLLWNASNTFTEAALLPEKR